MKPFPPPRTEYEIWYLDNYHTDVENWRMESAESYADALRVVEDMTQDTRTGILPTKIYVLEVQRYSVATQHNEFDKTGAG